MQRFVKCSRSVNESVPFTHSSFANVNPKGFGRTGALEARTPQVIPFNLGGLAELTMKAFKLVNHLTTILTFCNKTAFIGILVKIKYNPKITKLKRFESCATLI